MISEVKRKPNKKSPRKKSQGQGSDPLSQVWLPGKVKGKMRTDWDFLTGGHW